MAIAKVLKDEGFISDYAVSEAGVKSQLNIRLKYHGGQPVIDTLKRVSRRG